MNNEKVELVKVVQMSLRLLQARYADLAILHGKEPDQEYNVLKLFLDITKWKGMAIPIGKSE